MIKILFVCHGNICRSTMAEFVMKELVRRAGREHEFLIESAATSREEIGNDMHYGTRTKLREQNIPFTRRAARQITNADYDKYDYLVYNVGNNPDFHSYIYEAALAHPGMIILHDYMLYYLLNHCVMDDRAHCSDHIHLLPMKSYRRKYDDIWAI